MGARGASPTVTATPRLPALRPETIPRARLARVFDDAVQRPLTVVCAPAGYGKTTALVQWLQAARIDHAWLPLDARDNDPRRFAAHLLGALAPLVPGRLESAMRAVHAGSDLCDTVVALAAQELAARGGERLVIVADDYQAVAAEQSHRVTTALLDAMPVGVAVVVASRTPPPLRLARRRAAGTLAEVDPEQLRFRPQESEQLLNRSLGLALHPDELELVDARVRGWPAGLALIATALTARRDRTGFLETLARSRTQLGAYLIEEVLDAAPPDLRRFLCRTSVLGRLRPELCEAVLADPRAPVLLDEVRRTNLFVTPVDAERTWFRYHPAFAETLAGELRRREPELEPELHRRASAWFRQAGLLEEAIDHALLAGDGPHAAQLLATSWVTLVAQRRHATVRRILDRLPEQRGEWEPLCEALDLLCMVFEGVDQRITHARAEALAARHPDAPGVGALVDSLRISPFYGDVGRAVEVGRQAWRRHARSPESQGQIAGVYGLVLWFAGDRDGVRDVLEPRLGLEQPPLARVWTLGVLALTAADDGDAESAERWAREAMAVVGDLGAETATEFTGMHWTLAEALRIRGKLGEARRHLDRALDLEARRPGSVGHAVALVLDARLALGEGDRPRAARSARRAREIVDRYPDVGTLEARLAGVESELRGGRDDALLGTEPSSAELRVLALLDGDRTIAEIAAELYLSRNTVKSHVRRLYRRLGVSTRARALTAARERGLLDDASDRSV